MKYSKDEVMQFVKEEDVKFIRLAFCDVFGRQKNIAIMPSELSRAFEYGIVFDASAVTGFGDETHSDLLLHPDPETLMFLPWRPEHGKVVRMFTHITYSDGTPFECDTRGILKTAVEQAKKEGYTFTFGSEQEFYLFLLDENGKPTDIPYDEAGYMDLAPDDRGENIRREICLTLEQMGIKPESSHHKEGPGQNEINYRHSTPLSAADNAMTFQTVVKTVARRNGLYVDFSPKPLENKPGNGFHVNVSVSPENNIHNMHCMIAGVLNRVCEMTAFLNPSENSYARFGKDKAPAYVSWSRENRSQLVRIPASFGSSKRAELRSPDPTANPYIVFALVIYAALEGLKNKAELIPAADINLFRADEETLKQFEKLPQSLKQACDIAKNSDFIKEHIPQEVLQIYCNR
ncbi:MAG: glutamine synthetase family protein [Acutalibacteraceae bacterium]|nr:glutamine synthetase family protein [Acutalibacteraceae bacterium]